MTKLVEATTEARNPRTVDIDAGSTVDMLRMVNAEDAGVPTAVAEVIPELAKAVDLAVECVRAGGHVHYFGAGTSGRLATLDAAELLPTFNAPPDLVVAHHAGGSDALVQALEDVEDSADSGSHDASSLTAQDIAIGITASGRTPYVAGALRTARERGAVTVLIASDPQAELAPLADVVITPDTGPEVIAGSTRLKAGTAQKLVLNSFSTVLMIKLGRTWSNLMVSLVATNSKLRGRLIRILMEATGESEAACRSALIAADGELKTALVAMLAGVQPDEARSALSGAGGSVRTALTQF